jgi:soluble lytic murein transglycosylase-like protein
MNFSSKSTPHCHTGPDRGSIIAVLATALTFAAGSLPSAAEPSSRAALRTLVSQHAAANGVPVRLAHAVVMIESGYRPRIVHRGNYGLMQIRLGTARAMGFRGSPRQLLHPPTNVKYGMRYLGRAWRSSRHNVCGAVKRYQTGTGTGRLSRATLRYCAKAKRLMARR